MIVYHKTGKPITPRHGQIVPAGSLMLDGKKWVTLETDHIFQRTPKEFCNLTQSRIGGELILKEMK